MLLDKTHIHISSPSSLMWGILSLCSHHTWGFSWAKDTYTILLYKIGYIREDDLFSTTAVSFCVDWRSISISKEALFWPLTPFPCGSELTQLTGNLGRLLSDLSGCLWGVRDLQRAEVLSSGLTPLVGKCLVLGFDQKVDYLSHTKLHTPTEHLSAIKTASSFISHFSELVE